MRAIESRLARVEKAMQQDCRDRVDEPFERRRAEWQAAGGPMSFVCGATEQDARGREATLRELGLIQPIDMVVLMPMYPEVSKPFLRHCVFDDWSPAKRDAIKAALARPGREPPPEWYAQPQSGSAG